MGLTLVGDIASLQTQFEAIKEEVDKQFDKTILNPELKKYIKIDSCIYKSHIDNISKDIKKKERLKHNRWKKKTYWSR